MKYLQIILNLPVNQPFTYSYIPDENEKQELIPMIGKRAEIMFGNRNGEYYKWEYTSTFGYVEEIWSRAYYNVTLANFLEQGIDKMIKAVLILTLIFSFISSSSILVINL